MGKRAYFWTGKRFGGAADPILLFIVVFLPVAVRWRQQATVWGAFGDLYNWVGLVVAFLLFLARVSWVVPKIHADQERVIHELRDELRAHENSLKFKWIGPSPFEGSKEWDMFLVDGARVVALHQEAYGYYLGLSPDKQERFREYVTNGLPQRRFEKGDVLRATDLPKFARTMLDRFIGEGAELRNRLLEFGEDHSTGINILGKSVQKSTVEYWEQRVVAFLRRYFSSDEHEFMGLEIGSMLQRVEKRINFLTKIKDRI